jgi:hypothetical protein
VLRDLFDLRDSRRRRWYCDGTNLLDHLGRNCADRRPTLERRELDLEPAYETTLVRPDRLHGRAGVTVDH